MRANVGDTSVLSNNIPLQTHMPGYNAASCTTHATLRLATSQGQVFLLLVEYLSAPFPPPGTNPHPNPNPNPNPNPKYIDMRTLLKSQSPKVEEYHRARSWPAGLFFRL